MKISYATHGLLLIIAAAAITACQKEGTEPSIEFDGGGLPSPVFAMTGGSLTVNFTSSLDWTASSSEEWLTLDNESGSGGECSITLTATANESYEQRTAYVKMLSKTAATTLDRTLTVTQNQTDAIITDISSADIPWEGSDITILVSSNVDYVISIDASWITAADATKALSEEGLTFTVSKNWSADARSATISFKADSSDLAANVNVTQAANPDPGTGEETAFTQNCTEIGVYSGTGGETPSCTLAYSEYQYSLGSTSDNRFFRFVDFNKEVLTVLSLQGLSLDVGSIYTLVTSCSDNGNMVEKSSENLTLVSRKYGRIWLEDKTAGTGYIIPTE